MRCAVFDFERSGRHHQVTSCRLHCAIADMTDLANIDTMLLAQDTTDLANLVSLDCFHSTSCCCFLILEGATEMLMLQILQQQTMAAHTFPHPKANWQFVLNSGTEEVGLAAMEGWQWTPDMQPGVQWNLGGGQIGEGCPQPGSLEGVYSLPEAMAKSRQQASRRVSRSNSKQFERMTSQVTLLCMQEPT